VARQTKVKRTPELRFETDTVIRNALRIEDVLRGLREAEGPRQSTPRHPADTADPAGTG
jgi:hypothetical protein